MARSIAQILADLDTRDLLEVAMRIAKESGVPIGDLLAPSTRAAKRARHRLWLHLCDEVGFSYSVTGRIFDVDVSTVHYACRMLRASLGRLAAAAADTAPPPEAA